MAHRLIVGGELILYGDVGDLWGDGSGFSDREVIEALAELGPGSVSVRLNSGGGSAFQGGAIYNALRSHRGEVTIYIDALAASAASIIAMAGDKVIMREGALMMIHDPWSITLGDAEDHRNTAGLLDKIGFRAARIYADKSGLSEHEARDLMASETWFDAEEAVAFGFADDTEAVETEAAAAFDYTLFQKTPDEILETSQRELPVKSEAKPKAKPKRPARPRRQERHVEQPAVMMAPPDNPDEPIPLVWVETYRKTPTPEEETPAETTTSPVADDATHPEACQMDKIATAVAAEQATKETPEAAVTPAPAADTTREIMSRCRAARMSLEDAFDIVEKANGSVDKAKDLIIDSFADRDPDPTGGARPYGDLTVGEDARDKFREGAARALLARAGIEGGEVNEFSSFTVRELARESLTRAGVKTQFRDPMEMAGAALGVVQMSGGATHSTSDFPEVLANVANKSMLKGYMEAEETFERWTSTGSLTDFKAEKRVDLNLFPSLAKVEEGAEYTSGTMGERAESIQLATYGKMFSITRQAIINDDLSVFTRIPMRMGRAARRTIGNLVYAVLTDNAAMSDGNNLFDDTNHGNHVDSGAAPSVTSLDEGRAKMGRQTDPDGHTVALNIRPAYFLVPVELEGIARTLMASEFDPAKTQRTPNHVRGLAEVISDGRLSVNSTKAWYLAASPAMHDTIEVAYLNGNSSPVLEQREGWKVDGIEFKVRIDAGVKALDWRGLFKNDGE